MARARIVVGDLGVEALEQAAVEKGTLTKASSALVRLRE